MGDTLHNWERKLARYVEIGEQLADAKAEVENLENCKATVVAMAMKASGEDSVAAQTREAHASESYRRWCMDHYAAVRKAEGLRLRLKAAELWFEMVRTVEASRRAEMGLSR